MAAVQGLLKKHDAFETDFAAIGTGVLIFVMEVKNFSTEVITMLRALDNAVSNSR